MRLEHLLSGECRSPGVESESRVRGTLLFLFGIQLNIAHSRLWEEVKGVWYKRRTAGADKKSRSSVG